jgi:hypothetical protein
VVVPLIVNPSRRWGTHRANAPYGSDPYASI